MDGTNATKATDATQRIDSASILAFWPFRRLRSLRPLRLLRNFLCSLHFLRTSLHLLRALCCIEKTGLRLSVYCEPGFLKAQTPFALICYGFVTQYVHQAVRQIYSKSK